MKINMDLNLLSIFNAIYTEKNITKAGKSLGLTQSAVSQALGRLRLHFEDELFFRVSKGMEPTEKAHMIAPYISDALNSAEEAFFVTKEFDPMVSNQVFKIGMADIDTVFLGPILVNHFQKKAPNVQLKIIQVDSEKYLELMDKGEIEIAIHWFEKDLPKRFSSTVVFHDDLVVISRNNNPNLSKKPTLADFLDAPHLRAPMGNIEERYIDPLFSREQMRRRVALTVNHMLGVPILVKETNLVATVFLTLMNYCKDLKGLEIHDFPVDVPSIPISLIWHQKFDGNQACKWIIQEIQELCRTIDEGKSDSSR
ncbi:MAG: LysR family transcriptional regulator [Roseibium album]|uniref:LysR family transcriptional regulator n=1 Tax=Roseibium album TaxID=311410 RepID=UPI0032EF1176